MGCFMRSRRSVDRAFFVLTTCVVGCLTVAETASAQVNTEGFALNRYEPSERGSDWFVLESLDLRGHSRLAAGLVLDYAHDPLVIYEPGGEDERTSVVEHSLYGHVGGALVLWDRVRFGLSLPIAIVQEGEGGQALGTTFESENATTIGDLRISADVRLVGEYGDAATLAGGLRFYAPTGSRDSFTGDGAVRIVPQLLLAGDAGQFTYAGRVGVNVRTQGDDFGGADMGSEMTFAAALGLRVADKKLTLGPELFGSTTMTSDSFFGRVTTPLELIFGGHYDASGWRFGAGVGPGLTRGFGTPDVRVLASIEWFAPFEEEKPPPPPDRDGDKIIDPEDACPDEPGVRTDDPKTNGCPPKLDRDGDGILDDVDACPDEAGVASADPKKHGCPPPPDRDGDKIIDAEDACPEVPGEPNEDPKKHGCPPPRDSDGDGITDEVDACPDAPGEPNADPKKHGCPVARIEQGEIKIREQVQFAYNSDKILDASNFILEAVKKILDENPQIKKVSIEGHTDSKGGDAYNKTLSKRRAASVAKWLVKEGIDKKRLDSKGLGEERPIDSNDTEEGRANNRRVEFHIVDQEAGAQ
jgi:OOP family OmpA-OmpF porin